MRLAPVLRVVAASPLARRLALRLPWNVRRWVRAKMVDHPHEIVSKEQTDLVLRLKEALMGREETDLAKRWDWKVCWVEPSRGTSRYSFLDSSGELWRAGLVTVDFWDTLISRVRPAEGVKRRSALRAMLLEAAYSRDFRLPSEHHAIRLTAESRYVSAEGEASIRRVLGELYPSNFEALVDHEVEDEKTYTRPTEVQRRLPAGFVVLSDHYLSAQDLRLISKHHEIECQEIIVSSEFRKTKRRGDLFSVVAQPSSGPWIHIGDNQHSDVTMSRRNGAIPILVTAANGTSWNGHELDSHALSADLYEHLGLKDDASKLLADVSVIALSLVTFAIEEWLRGPRERTICYLSREGHVLQWAHTLLEPHLKDMLETFPRACHLPVSRTSSFGPSWVSDLEGGLSTLENQYPLMTGQGFVWTLGLGTNIALEVIHQNPGRSLRSPTGIWRGLRPSTQKAILAHLQSQHSMLRELLIEKEPSANYVFCDLGWKGSIQDALERVSGVQSAGVYLGLRGLKNSRKNKRGLVFDESRGKSAPPWADFVGPLERAFTLQQNTVMGYERGDGRVLPILSQIDDGPSAGRANYFQTLFPSVFNNVADAMLSVGFFGSDLEKFTNATLSRWMTQPTQAHASVWFDEFHSDAFGAAERVHYAKSTPNPEWLSALGFKNAVQAMQQSLWPQGFLAWTPVGGQRGSSD